MFITQVVIPVIIIAAVCFWTGMQWEKERRVAELRKPVIKAVRKPKKHVQYDWQGKIY